MKEYTSPVSKYKLFIRPGNVKALNCISQNKGAAALL